MRKAGSKIYYLVLLLALIACKRPFDQPAIPANDRPLVVEGFINAGVGAATTITLSRIQDLSRSDSLLPEMHAIIYIESKANESFPLFEDGSGKYTSDPLHLTLYSQYRLNISTADGNKYLSDFMNAKKTPPIDSLEWNQNSDVTIYVNSHDPLDSTRYYRWEYTETWNYRPKLSSIWGVKNRTIYFKDSLMQTDTCWRSSNSTDIITGNSAALSEDVISHYPITKVPINNEKISNRYSILVRQYALSRDAYEFYLMLEKNTQETGSLFTPQPSLLPTNIHCLTNPNQLVIGYVSASTLEEKRIFVRNSELQNWHYPGMSPDCSTVTIKANYPDSSIFEYPDTSFTTYYFFRDPPIVGTLYMVIVRKACTECTYYAGTNAKPSFW